MKKSHCTSCGNTDKSVLQIGHYALGIKLCICMACSELERNIMKGPIAAAYPRD